MIKKQKVKPIKDHNGNAAKCIHHWQIDPPERAESEGTCLKCGEKKNFRNQASVPYEKGLVFPSQNNKKRD